MCRNFYRENMTSFLNYVTATLRALFAWRGSNNKNTLFANFRPRGLYQAKSSMTQYNLHDIHLSLTKASALIANNKPWRHRFTHVFIRQSLDGTYYGMVMSVRVSVRPTLRPSGSRSARFPHFSPTCFDILSWNFAHDFVLMYYRSSSSVITLRQFLKELWLFVNLEYRKCTVFRSFLLHTLTYWAEILHITLF